jgi:hypothetical protein
MALVAFDFVFKNMLCMHEVCVIIFFQSLPFSVAFVTILSRDLTIPKNGIAVALVTGKAIFEDQGVIITRG